MFLKVFQVEAPHELKQTVDFLIEKIPFVNEVNVATDGMTKSSVFSDITSSEIRMMSGVSIVESAILSKLQEYFRDPVIQKCWINVMYEGSSVKEHKHDVHGISSGVAIYYYTAPKDSANLQVKENDTFEDIPVYDNMVVIHSSDLIHKVSRHCSSIPRICLVFNFTYAQID